MLFVNNLSVEFRGGGNWARVVDGVSFHIGKGEALGIVGESGAGKSVTARALMGLIPDGNARIAEGQVLFEGRDLLQLSEAQMSEVRGRDISMIFQEPMRCLNPAHSVGTQIADVVRRHLRVGRLEALDRAVELLELVGIPAARERIHDYPHMFSGGMCQRVMIAMALACSPKLLIADEPTTALDVTVQAQVLALLQRLQAQLGLAILFITHDLAVINQVCDRVAVMYAGQIVEVAPTSLLLAAPLHPYSFGLLNSIPRGGVFESIPGQVPSPGQWPGGCRFHPRCPHAVPVRCDAVPPSIERAAADRVVRCVRFAELTLSGIE